MLWSVDGGGSRLDAFFFFSRSRPWPVDCDGFVWRRRREERVRSCCPIARNSKGRGATRFRRGGGSSQLREGGKYRGRSAPSSPLRVSVS